jgi:hypothetical protein
MGRLPLARLLILFWALWFSLVALSNLTDFAAGLGLLPAESWWKSGNLALVATALRPVGLEPAAPLLLLGVVGWEALAAALFLRGVARPSTRNAVVAFTVGLGLFLTFVLLDEALLLYTSGIETTHFQVVIALLVSLLVVERFGRG